jgi:hypothetical protein
MCVQASGADAAIRPFGEGQSSAENGFGERSKNSICLVKLRVIANIDLPPESPHRPCYQSFAERVKSAQLFRLSIAISIASY